MDTYAQIKALAAIIADLAETGVWTERDVMEKRSCQFSRRRSLDGSATETAWMPI